jgi:hypothetical protein
MLASPAHTTRVPSWHLGYASSGWPIDEARLSAIATTHAQAYTQHFLRIHRSKIDGSSSGLSDFLERWAGATSDFSVAWNYVFGDVRRAVTEPASPEKIVQTAALLGLWIMMAGLAGQFSWRCSRSVRPILNNYLLPECSELEAWASGTQIALTMGHDGVQRDATFDLVGAEWDSKQAHALNTCTFDAVRFSFAPPLSIFPVGQDDGETYERTISELDRNDVERFNTQCIESLCLVKETAPSFLPWIGRVLRYVVPVRPPPGGGITSGSSVHWPGVIELSFDCGPFAIAEMLIHECAHQYFFLLARTGPVEDGTDPKLYYSPLKDTGRPIQMILTGYHAFANILLFYRACQTAKIRDNGYCARNEAALVPQLRQLEDALRQSKALTQVGQSLWFPLAARIHAQ